MTTTTKYDRHDITAHETRLINDGAVIGHVTRIQRSHLYDVWVAFAHDWDGEADGVYNPLVAGVYDDPDSGYREIERRAREAQAPEDECEGHESLNGADFGRTVYCDGSCQR